MQIQDPGEAIRQAASIMALHQEFVLTTHVNPDGDGLGSELALAWALRQMGKSVSILNHSSTPENYRWLDPVRSRMLFSSLRAYQPLQNAVCFVSLDTTHPAPLRSLEEPLRAAKGVKIVV